MKGAGVLGAVLAGGESRRYGREKAAELVAGKSLVARAAETLQEVFPRVVIVSSREPVTADWPHVPDLREGRGPLAGIEAALSHAASEGLEGVFVLACDLPLVDTAVVERVLAAAGDGPAAAPVRDGAPGIEPLCAVYHVSCLPAVTDALDRGDVAVHRAFESVGGVTTELSFEFFLNVNIPSDRERAEVALGREGD